MPLILLNDNSVLVVAVSLNCCCLRICFSRENAVLGPVLHGAMTLPSPRKRLLLKFAIHGRMSLTLVDADVETKVIDAVGILVAVEVSELSSAMLLTLGTSITGAERPKSLLFLVNRGISRW